MLLVDVIIIIKHVLKAVLSWIGSYFLKTWLLD